VTAEPLLDVLIPTFRRPAALAVTLASLTAQTLPRFRVVVSDQTEDEETTAAGEVQTAVRLLRARGRAVELHRHLPRCGLAEHRQSLLDRAQAPYALFLDDDVLCEPDLLARLLRTIETEGCGFVGAPLVGLSHLDDVRPHQQAIEPWDGPVRPERFGPGDPQWDRHHLHSAANAWHVQERVGATDADPVVYKVAWVGGCVLYDVGKLREVGGFSFWRDLPTEHCGEDVLAQLRVMERYGGCGVLPSGAYHQQLPTTVEDRSCDAPKVLSVGAGAAGRRITTTTSGRTP
jgi:GT2 family glycosyltransferase